MSAAGVLTASGSHSNFPVQIRYGYRILYSIVVISCNTASHMSGLYILCSSNDTIAATSSYKRRSEEFPVAFVCPRSFKTRDDYEKVAAV